MLWCENSLWLFSSMCNPSWKIFANGNMAMHFESLLTGLHCLMIQYYFISPLFLSNSVNLLFFHIVIKTLKPHVIIKREGKIKLPTCVTCLGPALFPLEEGNAGQWWRPSVFKPSTRENTGQLAYPLCALIYEMKTVMVLISHGGSKDLIKVSKTLGTGSSMLRALYKHLRCHPHWFHTPGAHGFFNSSRWRAPSCP